MDSISLLITIVSVVVPLLIVGVVTALVFLPMIRRGQARQQLLQSGQSAQATILQLSDTGVTINDNPVAEFLLDVRPQDRPAFQAQTRLTISRLRIPMMQPGMVVPVKYDPNDPSKVTIVL